MAKKTHKTLFFDFETTGLNPFHEKIIDYCFICEEDGTLVENLVNPNSKLSDKIKEITHLTDSDLQDKLPIQEHIDILRNTIQNNNDTVENKTYLIAHNCDGFDKHFLNELHKKYNISSNMVFMDTLLLTKKFIPDQYSFSLKSLCKRFGITPGTHRAKSDTVALQKLYHRILRIIESKSNLTYEQMLTNPDIVYNLIY